MFALQLPTPPPEVLPYFCVMAAMIIGFVRWFFTPDENTPLPPWRWGEPPRRPETERRTRARHRSRRLLPSARLSGAIVSAIGGGPAREVFKVVGVTFTFLLLIFLTLCTYLIVDTAIRIARLTVREIPAITKKELNRE